MKRFEVIHKEYRFGGIIRIIQDKNTGEKYLYITHGLSSTITPLLDKKD